LPEVPTVRFTISMTRSLVGVWPRTAGASRSKRRQESERTRFIGGTRQGLCSLPWSFEAREGSSTPDSTGSRRDRCRTDGGGIHRGNEGAPAARRTAGAISDTTPSPPADNVKSALVGTPRHIFPKKNPTPPSRVWKRPLAPAQTRVSTIFPVRIAERVSRAAVCSGVNSQGRQRPIREDTPAGRGPWGSSFSFHPADFRVQRDRSRLRNSALARGPGRTTIVPTLTWHAPAPR